MPQTSHRTTPLILIAGLLLLLTACLDNNSTGANQASSAASNKNANASSTETADHSCSGPTALIHDVQGVRASSPLVGSPVTVEGVVIASYQASSGSLRGYFVQAQDQGADSDIKTSEGIYVDDGTTVRQGDLVRVTGTVAETGGLTQLTRVEAVDFCGTADLPTPAPITFPLANRSDLEAYEGMLVTFPQPLTVAEHHEYDRYGEVLLVWNAEGRAHQPTSLQQPEDVDAAALARARPLTSIVLDDGNMNQNPTALIHPDGGTFTKTYTFRAGDTITGFTGVLDYRPGDYRLQPALNGDASPLLSAGEFDRANPRPTNPPDVGGRLRVAAFNVLNYFVDLTSGGNLCGVNRRSECRGADDEVEFERQRDKIVAAITQLDAQVVGLMEIQNDPDEAAQEDLVRALNRAAGRGTYRHVSTGGPLGRDVIRVAIIYQPAAVTPVGGPAVLDAADFVAPRGAGPDRNRAAIAQTFEENATGERFTVVVNHLKSKGSACNEPNENGPAANCDLTRTLAAEALLSWVAADPTGSGDPDYLLVGDYNSYAQEAPVRTILAGPDGKGGTSDDFTSLLHEFEGEHAYTYLFDGLLGTLDYAFASSSLTPQVTGAAAWHINADEPDILDYDLDFKRGAQADVYSPDPFRSSDHDPVLLGLDLGPSR